MIVMKFGGTSVADRQRIEAVAQIVAEHRESVAIPVVVVSAMGDTTDQLVAAGHEAEAGNLEAAGAIVSEIAAVHHAAAVDGSTGELINQLVSELTRLLEGAFLLREQTARSRALLLSFGERLCAPIVATHLQRVGCNAEAIDARGMVITDDRHEAGQVQLRETTEQVHDTIPALRDSGMVPVVTGFVASTTAGVTTTLGRGGSDYTAALLGALLEAQEIWIWTDVDGVLTADPRLVKEARPLSAISYREAAEMSYFGARVIHPQTIRPAVEAAIPIRVKNSFAPSDEGTVIAETAPMLPGGVKTVTSIEQLALVTIDGRGMVGVPGVARRIFEASEASDTNVIMISQSSSEQTVSVVVREQDAPSLIEALQERFSLELAVGTIETIEARREVAVVSIIGQGMAGTPGIAARLFEALAAVRVNIIAIAQGASELSISVAIDAADVTRAVRAAHTTFGLTHVSHVVLLGCGRVGGVFLQLLEETRATMADRLGLELRLVGVASSQYLAFSPDGIDPAEAADALTAASARPVDAELISHLVAQSFTEVIVVDVTAADTAGLHEQALRAGLHVVTANKRPLSADGGTYAALQAARAESGARYGFETTFGAGLPVLHSLQELVNTGDELISVTGCLSGTLGYICSRLQSGDPLKTAVEDARAHGFTEPDPREDLSGADVSRKALIIARAAGFALEPEQIEHQPFLPGLDAGLDAALQGQQEELAAQIAAARDRGEVLRYTAEITPSRVRVGPSWEPIDSPIGALSGPDNILVFRTRRYDDNPLVIQGPGAGAEVTAAGVLADVLKIATR